MKVLAIDLGGTHATCAIVERQSILAKSVVPASGKDGLAPMLPLFDQALGDLLGRLSLSVKDCAGLAMAFCGLVDVDHGRVLSTNQKYDDAPGLDLGEWCRTILGLPFRLENDARMALLGERTAGVARGFDDVVMITLGTGIGGAAMIGGRLLRGRHYQAGCLGGHFPVAYNGRRCNCGNLGCAEAQASGWALPEICQAWPNYQKSALAREERLDFSVLFRLAERGDSVCQEIVDHCLQIWAAASVAQIHAYDPEMLVFGGGVMKSEMKILPFIRQYVEENAWTPWGNVAIMAAELGPDAALLGATSLLEEFYG